MKRSDLDTYTVLNAVDEHGQMLGYQKLCEQFPEKIVDAAFEREVDAGRLDYGVSLRTAWLEPEGQSWLRTHRLVECLDRATELVGRLDTVHIQSAAERERGNADG